MKILFAILLFIPLSTVAAQPTLPKEKADALFISLQKGDMSGGYDRLFFGSGISQSKPQMIDVIKLQTQNGLPLYGKILGYEFINEQKYGTSLVRLVYILKSEKFLTTWEFYFYKPKESWFLASIKFNDQFDLLK